ncbi:poly(U)-specific 3'-to-5' RNA exonuclease [Tulasnella sp. 330]|nr:poly(U)-specific 3'-to-5' RNA exonuclease [Tulasnella sp. 330]KAG8875680.1 poly(U)-specific 3'-to-5' RNA exonuclease [Tulasnella sp. 331]KAG8880984.1 poly(U)-specific 3'-to-5' RNA exonuclease [Tulasnella sp. 332]
MKRKHSIVDYGSSSDSNGPEACRVESGGSSINPPKRQKALVSLPEIFEPEVPVDNPALHQGRQRTRPHVEGQFVGHIYIAVRLNGRLRTILQEIVDHATTVIPSLQSLVHGDAITELHISLSRPIYLRAHQREELRRGTKAVCRRHAPFASSFAQFAALENDEKTRTFLVLEVGAGYSEIKALSDDLDPHIRALYQAAYYEVPRFHISIAWALLQKTNHAEGRSSTQEQEQLDSSQTPKFLEVKELLASLLEDVESRYASQIRNRGRMDVDTVEIKIGKVVTRCRLGS